MDSSHYQDLEAWRKAMDLVVECHRITRLFPRHDIYKLTRQLQQAAVAATPSAGAVEGREQRHKPEFRRHLSSAYRSLTELETHIHMAQRLDSMGSAETVQLLDRTRRVAHLLNGLVRSLDKANAKANTVDKREK